MIANIALYEKKISINYIVELYFPFLILHYMYETTYVNGYLNKIEDEKAPFLASGEVLYLDEISKLLQIL